MSNTTTTSGSALPSGLTTAGDLSSSLAILLVGTVGSSFLIPISAVLLYFKSGRTLRRPMYLVMLASLVLGLGEGGLNMYNQISAIRHTAVPTAVTTTYTMVHLFLPLVTESVLVFRVTAMHPPKRLPRLLRALIYVPITLLKIARIVVLVAVAISWIANSQGLPAPVKGGLDALTQINRLPSQARWALQVADTLFMSILFFPRSAGAAKKQPQDGHHHARDTEEEEERPSLWVRFKMLFWAAVSSFVFPVLLNLIQFALVLVQDGAGVLQFPSLFAVNNQAGIVGMVFATVFTPSAAHPKPVVHRAPTAGVRPGLSAHPSDGSFKSNKYEGEPDAAVLPELLSGGMHTASPNWMAQLATGMQPAHHHDPLGGLASLMRPSSSGGSGRSSPTGGLGDIGGMLGNVAGAFGGVDGALGHVGHNLNLAHVGQNLRHLAHGLGESVGKARAKVEDLEAGVIREEKRVVAEVKGKARSAVDRVRHHAHAEVEAVGVEARAAAGAMEGKAGAAMGAVEQTASTAVGDVGKDAREEIAGVEARMRDAGMRVEDRVQDEVGAVEAQAGEAERGAEDRVLEQMRTDEARVYDAELSAEEGVVHSVRAEEARVSTEMESRDRFDV